MFHRTHKLSRYFTLLITNPAGFSRELKTDVQTLAGSVADTFQMAKMAASFLTREAANGHDFLVAMLSGDEQTKQELGGRYAEAFSVAAEVLQICLDDFGGMDERARGLLLGRFAFEIAAAFMPASRIGYAGKLGKADFLTNLLNRPMFKKTPGSAIVRKMGETVDLLRNTRMCFVASTLVLCQVVGAVETHHIGSLQSLATAHPDLTVWSNDEFTGETGWRRPVTWFTTHLTELHHSSYDVGLQPNKSLCDPVRTSNKVSSSGRE